jgi:hypothetical protein
MSLRPCSPKLASLKKAHALVYVVHLLCRVEGQSRALGSVDIEEQNDTRCESWGLYAVRLFR